MVGEFKDDQIEKHTHIISEEGYNERRLINLAYQTGATGWPVANAPSITNGSDIAEANTIKKGRTSNTDVTRGKRKGIKYIIKVL